MKRRTGRSPRRGPPGSEPTVSPLRVLLCLTSLVIVAVLSVILTLSLKNAGETTTLSVDNRMGHTQPAAAPRKRPVDLSISRHSALNDVVEVDSGHKQCEMVGIFEGLTQIKSVSKLKVWPLPHKIELYEKEWLLSPTLSWKSNFKHPILTDAVSRYSQLIFQHTIDSENWNGIHSDNVFDTVIVHVDSSDDTLQLGFDESYELLISPETPQIVVESTEETEGSLEEGDDSEVADESERRRMASSSCRGKVMIKSGTVFGALRALETLSQLARFSFSNHQYRVRLGWIQDKPQHAWRGIHLDTARHFHPVYAIKHLLDAMSYAKFNVFHWHLVDEESFPFESKAFPKLWNGSYSAYERYSEEDLLEVVSFARFRGIRVVPEFDTPGHAGSWCVGYPQLCISAPCRKPSPTLFDPSNAFTWQLIEGVLAEAHSRFPDSHVHLGMDEVRFECYDRDAKVKKWLATVGLAKGHDIYKYWADRLTLFVSKTLKQTPVVWEEVFRNAKSGTPKGTVVHIWMGKDWVKQVARAGYQVLVSSGWYLDHVNTKWQDYYTNNIHQGLSGEKEKALVLGGEACMWSEHIDLSVLDATVWPKAAAAAEKLWSSFTDISSAFERLEHFRCTMMHRGVGGGPLKHQQSRVAPDNPHSCFQE